MLNGNIGNNLKTKFKKDNLKSRQTPPCSSAMSSYREHEKINNNTMNKPLPLCLAFNEIFVEKNLGNIMETMKFSLGSPIPFSLKDMAGLNYHNSDDYKVLFPNGGNLNYLRELG